MDWGIVASVVVAIVLLIAGIVVLAVLMFGLMARGMKKKLQVKASAGDGPVGAESPDVVRSCPMTFCPMNKMVKTDQVAD